MSAQCFCDRQGACGGRRTPLAPTVQPPLAVQPDRRLTSPWRRYEQLARSGRAQDVTGMGRARRTGRPAPGAGAASAGSAAGAPAGRAADGTAGRVPGHCGACGRNAPGRGRDAPPPARPWSCGRAYPRPGQARAPCGPGRPARSARLVPPAAVAQVAYRLAMRPAAGLAAPAGAHEPDPVADLRPVDRVEISELRPDRHNSARIRLPGPRCAPWADDGREWRERPSAAWQLRPR